MRDRCLCKNMQKVVSEFGVQINVYTKGGRDLTGKCVPVERYDGRRVRLKMDKLLAPDLDRIKSAC